MRNPLLNDEQYTPSQENVAFDPTDVLDLVPSIEAENKRQNEARDVRIQSMKDNDRRRIAEAKRPNILQELGAFSETLTNQLIEVQKKKNEADLQRGVMLAYADGVTQEEQEEFNAAEEEHRQTGKEAEAAAQEVEEQTGDPLLAERVRGMSDWERYGYMKGQIQLAGINFPAFVAANKDKVSVVINGNTVTYETAETPEEYAALQGELTSQYLSSFAGMNPALLNKYLFGKVREYNATDAANWAAAKAQERAEIRREDRKADFFIDVESGNTTAASDFILSHPNGPREGKKELFEILESGLRDGSLKGEYVLQILNQEFYYNGDTTPSTLLTGKDKSIFGGLVKLAEDAIAGEIDRDTRRLDDEVQAWTNGAIESIRERVANGGELTDADKEALRDDFQSKFPDRPLPTALTDLFTAEEADKQDARDRLNDIIDTRGYLIASDLDGVPARVAAEYQEWVEAGEAITEMPTRISTDADAAIKAAVREQGLFNEGTKELTTAGLTISRRARRDFERLYAAHILAGKSKEDALELALTSVQTRIKAGEYSETEEVGDPELSERLQSSYSTIGKDPSTISTQVFLTDEELKQAEEAYKTRGRKDYPQIVRLLASKAGMDPWTFTQQQLVAAGRLDEVNEEMKPAVEQDVDKLSPEIQDFLRSNPTPSRVNRAVIESEATGDTKWFLDTVASKESEAYGGYEAMNMGGSGIGPSNQAYGSANSCDKSHGCLSSMTLGQVMALQVNGDAFAVGRYQFIPTTLKETVEQLGISLDTPFDAATQDALAIGRLRWRLSVQNSMLGLRNEWQGLWHLPDAKVQELLGAAREIVSVYDDPRNILPALRS